MIEKKIDKKLTMKEKDIEIQEQIDHLMKEKEKEIGKETQKEKMLF